MYERSRRSAKSPTNSVRCASERGCQWRAIERLAISPKSKISLAIFRTATRRSATLSAPLKLGSSRVLSTRSTAPRSWSVGPPAAAGTAVITASPRASSALFTWNQFIATSRFESLHLAEDVLGEQLLDVDRRLDLADPAVGRDDLVGAAGADADVALADQALGLDRGDRVVLQLHPGLDHHDHVGLVVLQHDAVDPAHLHPRDLDGGAGLEPAHGGKVRAHHVAPVGDEMDAAVLDRHPPQRDQAHEHEQAHAQIQSRSPHRVSLLPPCSAGTVSTSPRMNCWTTAFAEPRTASRGPRSAMVPSWRIATRSAISKISGISWLTITAGKRNLRCRSTIRWWMVLTRIGSRPVVGSSKKTISGSVTRARAMATRLRMPPEISAGSLSPMPPSPTCSSFSSTRSRISASVRRLFSRRGKATFSKTDMESEKAPPWKATP